jgi:RNA polymerase sigma-70 factor, ECF subfamily
MALPYFFLPDHGDPSPRLRPGGDDRAIETVAPDSENVADRDRVESIRRGNEHAFSELFLEFHISLHEFATTYVGSAAVAEEIVQDVFLHLWIRRAEWNPARGIRAYLFRAVRNRATDDVRHRQVGERIHHFADTASAGMGEAPAVPGDDTDVRAFAIALYEVLNHLPSARRQAAFLRWRHGLSFAEIAEALGTSTASATMHIQRARDAVRPVIEKFTKD